MNAVLLVGRLTKDPEVRYTNVANPLAVARFTLACDRKRKAEGQPSADFISCVAFGKTAEFIEKYFKKGMKVEAEGSWQTGSYKKDDGTTVYTNDCVLDHVAFAESKNASSNEAKPDADGFVLTPDGFPEELPFK